MTKVIQLRQPPLLDKSQTDQALRDLMPLIEHLTNFDTANREGAKETAANSLTAAVLAFRSIPEGSPAVTAYIRWLEQNTEAEISAPPTSSPTASAAADG
jgi:hypothetical protein